MRRLVALTMLFTIVAVGAMACGGGDEATNTPTTNPTVSLEPTSTTQPSVTASPSGTTTPQPTGSPSGGDPARGQQVAQSTGCIACHSIDGATGTGPTWQGLYGKTETMADGSTVQVDDTYLHESIVDPNAKVVEGFTPGIMPQGYGDTLREEQIQDILAYIRSLQ